MPDSASRKHDKAKTQTSLLSGAVSGLASCVILQPLDLLKTRLQQGSDSKVGVASSARPRLLETVKLILRNDGLVGLWRGTTPTVARNVPGVSLYFASLNQLRSVLPNTTSGNLLAGATARTSVGFMLMPMTVVKTRMESSLYSNKNGVVYALRNIWQTQGIRGLFAGFWPTTLRDAPTAGLFLATYEQTRTLLQQSSWLSDVFIDAASGGFAAGFSTLLTAPFDTIKTRRQLLPMVYTGMSQASRMILSQEGPVGFFRGVSLRCLRKAASSSIAWSLYENLVRKWGKLTR